MVCRTAFLLGLVWSVLGFASHLRAQALGSWAHPDQAEIRDTVAFTSKSITQALKKDKPLIAAAARQVPVAEYLALLEQRVSEGYLRAGYGRVHVVATVDSAGTGRVVLDIDEGPQFRSGAIVVSGLSPELGSAVRQRIVNRDVGNGHSLAQDETAEPPPFCVFDHRSQPQVDPPQERKKRQLTSGSQRPAATASPKKATNDCSLWKTGQPAKLDSVQLRQLRERVRLALVEAGYAEAEFELTFAYRDQLADLQVQVTKLGTVATVAEIDVQGNVTDTDEEIIRYTGLKLGEPWTAQRREALRVCLLEAARYIEPKIDEQNTAGQVRLTIHIAEYPAAPPLHGEASPEEQVCFKYREWLERGDGYQLDQVLTASSREFEGSLVLSPREGLIVEAAIGATAAQRESTRCGLLLSSTELHVYLAQLRWKMCIHNTFAVLRLVPNLQVTLKDDGTIGRNLSFGANLQNSEAGGPPASTGLTISVAPLLYRAMARDNLLRAEWQGEELVLWKTIGVMRLDAKTGALREIAGAQDGGQYKLQIVPGAYRARRSQLETATQDWRAFPDPARRLGSSVEFACAVVSRFLEVPMSTLDEVKRIDRRGWQQRVALAGRLAGLGLLDPVEQWWSTPRDPRQKRFEIPTEDGATSGGLVGSAVTVATSTADEACTEGQWPAFMLQQTCSLLSGQRAAAGTTAQEICERYHFGPLACCAGAMLLAKSQKDLSEELAAIGLQRLDRESYLRDCRTLFDPASSVGVVSRCWFGVLAQLTPREIDLIDSYLWETGMLHRCAEAFQRHATEEDPPLAAAGEMWDQWLHGYLESKLFALRGLDPLLSSPFPLPTLQR